MTSATMYRDGNGHSVEVFRPVTNSGKLVATSGTAVVTSGSLVRVWATHAGFVRFSTTHTATALTTVDCYIGADTAEFFKVDNNSYISYVKAGVTGTAYVSTMR